jgi:acetyl esterase
MELEAYDSYNDLSMDGIVYDAAFMGYARGAYLAFKDWKNPLASPIHQDQAEMPPTIAIIGTDDPLLDQVLRLKALSAKVKGARVKVITYTGMPHCFYSLPALFAEEVDCYHQIQLFLHQELGHESSA